jgi:hypothetical protein
MIRQVSHSSSSQSGVERASTAATSHRGFHAASGLVKPTQPPARRQQHCALRFLENMPRWVFRYPGRCPRLISKAVTRKPEPAWKSLIAPRALWPRPSQTMILIFLQLPPAFSLSCLVHLKPCQCYRKAVYYSQHNIVCALHPSTWPWYWQVQRIKETTVAWVWSALHQKSTQYHRLPKCCGSSTSKWQIHQHVTSFKCSEKSGV